VRSSLFWSVDVVTIDRARVLRGWTRRELGHEAHVDEGTLCDLFAGRRRPTFGTLRALCGALDLTLEDVLVFASQRVAGTMLNSPVSSS
jgi:transcriptional regulator with XRE-family HTH domain